MYHHLNPSHASFYTRDGVRLMARHLNDGGAFALWSDDPPDSAFTEVLGAVFGTVETHVVSFDNPLIGGESSNSVYVAR